MEIKLGIADDFYNLKSQWKNFSPATKVYFFLSFVFSCLSLSSLADQVYDFKGFVLYAIEFWRIISNCFHDLLDYFGVEVEIWKIDYWTVLLLVTLPYLFGRWKYFSGFRKLRLLVIALLNFSLPIFFPAYASLIIIGTVYFFIIVISFWPPIHSSFLMIGFRMLAPPIVVAIVAAISEGLLRQ